MSVNLVFSGTSQMEEVCHDVQTLDDGIVENTELFFLSIATTETQVMIPISTVTALINDDDGMFFSAVFAIYHR